ncbi:MAG TPA: hypothetical protein VIR00_16495, partial [Micromonosporaceae bacterium]
MADELNTGDAAAATDASCAAGPTEERVPCDVNELRTLFLFEKLDDDQLQWLCEHGSAIRS